jgi:hypothetical protein
MAKQKIWNVYFVAGNPRMFEKVRSVPDNPMRKSDALEAASKIAANGWRVWVEHFDNYKRIYESPVEREFRAQRILSSI